MSGVPHARDRVAYARSEPFSVVEVQGPDAASFLQAQLPADLAAISPGTGVFTARLDAKGRIRFLSTVLVLEDRFWILVENGLGPGFVEDLGRFHIREQLEIRDRRPYLAVLELHGPNTPEVLTRLGAVRPELDAYRHREWRAPWGAARFVAHPWTGEIGGHLIVAREHTEAVLQILAAVPDLRELTDDDLEVLRVEGGLPNAIDLGERTLLQEMDRDAEMVSYDKGCFLGQETVARVHSRGQVNRLWRGLILEGTTVPTRGSAVLVGGEPVGETAGAAVSVGLGGAVALARVRRRHAAPGTVVHVDCGGSHVAARVSELPLFRRPGPAEEAERLYREGLASYQRDRFEEACGSFERAVLLNPGHYAAYEAIGVSQERMGRMDDAVATMQELAAMDPDNPMAWTNLSRYYAQQGRIEEAESAKGKAMALAWKRQAAETTAKRQAEESAGQRRARLEDRVGLFRQVLEMDSDDVVANFGLGKVLLDLERFEEAAPCFAKAVAAQPDYSMAFNHWGTCLLRLKRNPEAADVFRRGIEAATRKGDLMPKRDMERKLLEAEA